MKPTQIELLGRIDERTAETRDDVKELTLALKRLNGSVRNNTIWRKCIIGVGSSLFLALFGLIAYVAGLG